MSNDLVLNNLETLNPLTVFSGGLDEILQRIVSEAKAILLDPTTAKGRADIASLAYKIARSKTLIDDAGKRLGEDAKATLDKINADRRKARDSLDALKEEVRKPLTDWEQAEKERVDRIQARLAEIEGAARFEGEPSLEAIEARIQWARAFDPVPCAEMAPRAKADQEGAITALEALLVLTQKREEEKAELERLRAEKAEHDRREAERLAKEREEQLKAKASEAARLKAEEDSARAIQAERDRAEREVRIAEAKAASALAEQKAAEARAEQDKQAAVEAERRRVADQAKAEAEARAQREEDREHKRTIHGEALAALTHLGISEKTAKKIITEIALGNVPHITIDY